jgi:adenine-specific DNA-methyltransferase
MAIEVSKATNHEDKLKQLLVELFQLDKSDLDFGIYRIMNLLHNQVKNFIENELYKVLEEVRDKLLIRDQSEIKHELKEIESKLISQIGENFETQRGSLSGLPAFRDLFALYDRKKELLSVSRVSAEVEADIYNDVYRFFERYYDNGDIVPKPRAGKNAYVVPYNGDETNLHWATIDQYYVKTGENFNNYTFNNEEDNNKVTVKFFVVEAAMSQNSNKNQKGRVFIPTEDYFFWDEETSTLNLEFYFKVPNDDEKEIWGERQSVKSGNKGINERLLLDIEERITNSNNEKLISFWKKETKVIGKNKVKDFHFHLHRFVNLNTFDYFIHKDLKEFLRQELDYFLKNDIFSLNFLALDWSETQMQETINKNVVKASIIRSIAEKIIDFLTEIEDFQKVLFEKKKMVIQSDYCMTMDRIPESVYQQIVKYILEDDSNNSQLKEWLELGLIDDLEIGYEYIKEHDLLVLDSKFLSDDLKYTLLSSFDNIDEECNGLLIHSENWQALNFLQNKYSKKVKVIYIDPPYNTSEEAFVYKNGYKHSSWMSMMENRVSLAKKFLKPEGVIEVAIDDTESSNLKPLMDMTFGSTNFISTIAVEINPAGQNIRPNAPARSHDYCHVYARNIENAELLLRELTPEEIADYKETDSEGKFKWDNLRRRGGNSRPSDRKNQWYPLYINAAEMKVSVEPFDGAEEIWPIDPAGEKRIWRVKKETAKKEIESGDIGLKEKAGRYELEIVKKSRMPKGKKPKTLWSNKRYSATSHGTKLLGKYLDASKFSYPKSLYLVEDCIKYWADKNAFILDFFAGSGTTGHAVMNLNGQDKDSGNRKYILVEMGEYFETVLKPRIQKVMYSNDWKNRKPEGMDGTSHMFQYIYLEQYEDTLNNIFLPEIDEQLSLESTEKLRYRLEKSLEKSPCVLDIGNFEKPFSYKMEITRGQERNPDVSIDLVSTFNFLLGLDVEKILTYFNATRKYRVILGKRDGQDVGIIWREYDENLDLATERDWLLSQKWFNHDIKLFVNGDNAFGAVMIENEFFRLMFESVTGDHYAQR